MFRVHDHTDCLKNEVLRHGTCGGCRVALPYAKSHYYMINKIGEDLVSRGHNVTILVADIDRDIGDAALESGINNIVYETPWGTPAQLQDLKDTIQYAAELTVLQVI